METKSLNSYKNNGTAYIPSKDGPLTENDILLLQKCCEEVDKEFIEIGDAGEMNSLLVGRFMTDIDKPRIVKNSFSEKVIKILETPRVISFIKKVINCDDDLYLRRIQFNEISENCFVGLHLDKDSNPDYLAACVLQLGKDFEGGIFRVYNKNDSNKFVDYKPEYGSLTISDCDFPHEVTRVTKGKRGSLVFFVSRNNDKNKRYKTN